MSLSTVPSIEPRESPLVAALSDSESTYDLTATEVQMQREAAYRREMESRSEVTSMPSPYEGTEPTFAPVQTATRPTGATLTEENLQWAYNSMWETQIYGTRPYGIDRPGAEEAPFPIQQAVNDTLTKEFRKKWKKIFNIEKPFDNNDLIPFYLFIQSLKYKNKLEREISKNKHTILALKKSIRDSESVLEKEKVSLDKNKRLLKNDISEEEKMRESMRIFGNIREMDEVSGIEINDGNFLIKTKTLYTKKKNWKKPRVIGTFLIRFPIDIEKNHQISILNTMMRMDIYDHPCIKNTEPCLGNVQSDLTNDIERGDILELISDILAYIQSPDEQAGYISKPNHPADDKMGWEWFLEKAEKVKEGFDFEEWKKISATSGYVSVSTEINYDTAQYTPIINMSTASISTEFFGIPRIYLHPPLFVQSESFLGTMTRHILNNIHSENPSEIMEYYVRMAAQRIRSENVFFIKRIIFDMSGIRIFGMREDGEHILYISYTSEITRRDDVEHEVCFQTPRF